jgi:hypothetical protein
MRFLHTPDAKSYHSLDALIYEQTTGTYFFYYEDKKLLLDVPYSLGLHMQLSIDKSERAKELSKSLDDYKLMDIGILEKLGKAGFDADQIYKLYKFGFLDMFLTK